MLAAASAQAVVVEIEGVTAPASVTWLADAVAAVWKSIKSLPLDYETLAAYEVLFGNRSGAELVQGHINRCGELTVTFTMGGTSHMVRIRPADRGEK
jgi:hypothetical protein